MNRRLWACIAVLAIASGCQSRSQGPAFDPFLNRATIPPPPTGSAAGGVAPAYQSPSAPAGAAGAYAPPYVAPQNPAQPYGPPATGLPPAGQFTPPQIQAPAGSAPYTPPSGYNYQNQYRQGAANEPLDVDSPVEERGGRRQVAARNNYDETDTAAALAENATPPESGMIGGTQIRRAAETQDTSPVRQVGFVRPVSYESASPANNPGNSTLRFVDSGDSGSNPSLPRSTIQSSASSLQISTSPVQNSTRNTITEQRFTNTNTNTIASTPELTIRTLNPPAPKSVPVEDSLPATDTSVRASEPAVQAASESPPASTARFAHDAQYQWLNGRLEYSQLDRRWKLRYIEIDGQTDSFGGSVVLTDPAALEGFRPGEFVTVRGTVDATQTAPGSFAPGYRLQQIQRTGN